MGCALRSGVIHTQVDTAPTLTRTLAHTHTHTRARARALTLHFVDEELLALVVDADEAHVAVELLVDRLVARLVVRDALLEVLHRVVLLGAAVVRGRDLHLLRMRNKPSVKQLIRVASAHLCVCG